ncbi:chemotaxis protein CheB, partial [Cupriavidus plantarum]
MATSLSADSAEPTPSSFPLVGIGASAGGLEALSDFFGALPGDTGAAFLIVQHLDPSHESLLPGILATRTEMEVVEAVDGMQLG